MTSKETEQLLKNELTDTQERRKTNTRRRFVILCILDALFFQTISMLGYIVNEWIQNTLKLKYFPRGDFSGQNISSCVNNSDSNEKYELYAKVQQETAHWAMYNNIAQQTTACVSCVLLSCYTDTYGRKFLFILSTLSVIIRTGTICVVMYLKQSFVFVVGAYAIEGVLGSCFAFITASFLVVADIFPEKKARVLAVTSVEANLLFSVMISGLVSGILADKFGFLLTTLICLCMAILSFILAMFLLPETLRSEHRSRPPSIFEALKRPFQFYMSSTFAERRLEYILLILAFGFGQLGVSTRSSIETVYLLGMPFCWTPTRIGYFELVRFAGQIFIGLVSVKILQKVLSSKAIAIISTVFCFASYMVEAFAKSELTFYMGMYLLNLSLYVWVCIFCGQF